MKWFPDVFAAFPQASVHLRNVFVPAPAVKFLHWHVHQRPPDDGEAESAMLVLPYSVYDFPALAIPFSRPEPYKSTGSLEAECDKTPDSGIKPPYQKPHCDKQGYCLLFVP